MHDVCMCCCVQREVVHCQLSALVQSLSDGESSISNDYELADHGGRILESLSDINLLPHTLVGGVNHPIRLSTHDCHVIALSVYVCISWCGW